MTSPDPKSFYLGRLWDPAQAKTQPDKPLQYDPADLTTHGVVTGMTGSGKTGLCIGLLEEAALQGIPAIMIDPKGDLTNLLLHFPDMTPTDFEPWIDAEAARREGKTQAEMALEVSERWRNGLADWGIAPERVAALRDAAHFTVFTPGSDAGTPVSILASLAAPGIPWEGNREIIRERVSSTVTALLGLVGLKDIDPVRSREHILLSNIFEGAWKEGRDLDLGELIMQTQSPPFSKLGVFPVDSFFPQKDRFELAMLLNNFLAAPAFQTWMEGQPLDIGTLLVHPDGRPRHSIFYLAHLPDAERMFFVTLLFSSVETWMRTQAGSSSLRTLVYFDEIVGYLPPVANPPSKPIMMRMLKQARAFGVGLLLATQNPVDIDYKALSNAGTWFIGKLQTDQDKARLLDGLESASGGLDRSTYDRLISGLGKRVFLLHNVHEKQPVLFQTRWTMNYLAGPLTRSQIPALRRLSDAPGQQPVAGQAVSGLPGTASRPGATSASAFQAAPAIPASEPVRQSAPAGEGSTTRPALPAGVAEYFFPNNQTLNAALQAMSLAPAPGARDLGLIFRPALLAQAQVRYLARQYNLDFSRRRTALVTKPDRRGMLRWDDFPYQALDPSILDNQPPYQARFASVEAPLSDARLMTSMEKDFLDWVYRGSALRLRGNPALKIYASPDESAGDFREQVTQAARHAAETEAAKLKATYAKKLAALKDKLGKEQRELDRDQEEHSQRKMEELGTHAETILGGLFGKSRRRGVSTSLSKRRMTSQAKADVEESRQAIASFQAQIEELETAQERELQALNQRWAEVAAQSSEVAVNPLKKDVYVEVFGVAWLPYYRFQNGQETIEVPGFKL